MKPGLALLSVLLLSGCAALRNRDAKTYEYLTTGGQAYGGTISWPAQPKDIIPDDLKKAKQSP